MTLGNTVVDPSQVQGLSVVQLSADLIAAIKEFYCLVIVALRVCVYTCRSVLLYVHANPNTINGETVINVVMTLA